MIAHDGGADPKVVVEVGVFSGVPNPTWTLDADSAGRLVTLLSHLTPVPEGTAPRVPDLGFRGFLVRGLAYGSDGGSPGTDTTLYVRGEDVIATAGDRRELFTDPRHEMYTMLRDLALDQMPSDIASHLPAGGPQP